ncbi:7018_t:CDS:2 [Paraglomus brasilianum]|uniref:7018_t:CDS:1 n=1 Tax=Paraglomus brasilianum TaxID=144538 RepID=A0A9N8WFC6_9GLOM|nr:7018_t:CDS:2 [Paraglomus brasilianum]
MLINPWDIIKNVLIQEEQELVQLINKFKSQLDALRTEETVLVQMLNATGEPAEEQSAVVKQGHAKDGVAQDIEIAEAMCLLRGLENESEDEDKDMMDEEAMQFVDVDIKQEPSDDYEGNGNNAFQHREEVDEGEDEEVDDNDEEIENQMLDLMMNIYGNLQS